MFQRLFGHCTMLDKALRWTMPAFTIHVHVSSLEMHTPCVDCHAISCPCRSLAYGMQTTSKDVKHAVWSRSVLKKVQFWIILCSSRTFYLLWIVNHVGFLICLLCRVSTTPGNLLEFVWSSWKCLCKISMIDCIGFQSWWNRVPDRLFKKLVALFIFATAPMLCISCFCSIFRQTSKFGTLHSRLEQCKRPGFFLKSLLESPGKFS